MIPVAQIFWEKNQYNKLYKICHYPIKDCHHGDLGIVLGELRKLTKLSIKYGKQNMSYNYHPKYFDFSYVDIERLGR